MRLQLARFGTKCRLFAPLYRQVTRIVSAMLIGAVGGIFVPRGRDVGGTFAHMPPCRAATQTGFFVAYSSFRVTAPPAANTLFGRSADSTLVAACTNPAALGGGEGDLNGYFDAEGRTAMPMAPSDPWTVGGQPIETPMVRVVGLLKGQCTRPLAQALANPFWR